MLTRLPSRSSVAPGAFLLLCTACFDPIITGDPDGGTDESDSGESDSAISASTGLDEDSGASVPVCGDGLVEGDEACDDGTNNGSYGGCAPDCRAFGPSCGDGIVNGTEACDDGDEINGNGCNVDCVVSGSVLWTVTYDGPGNGGDHAADVVTDSTGAVIVSGNSMDSTWLRKYSSDGALLWGIPTNSSHNGPVELSANDFAILSGSYEPSLDSFDAWIQAFGPTGEPSWTQTHANPENTNDRVTDLSTDSDGFIYALFQETDEAIEIGHRTFIRKYDPMGTELWTKSQANETRATELATSNTGNIVIAGHQSGHINELLWLQSISSDGIEDWTTTLTSSDRLRAMDINSEGEIALGVWSPTELTRILRISPTGSLETAIPLHQSAAGAAINDIFLEDNGSLLAGGSVAEDNDTAQGWVSRYSSNNMEAWTQYHDGPFDSPYSYDSTLSISTDGSGNVFASGIIMHHASYLGDAWVTKYAP